MLERRGRGPVDGYDQVTAAEPPLPINKPLQLLPALVAGEEARRQHRHEEGHGNQRGVDPRPPLLPPGDTVTILEDPHVAADLEADLALQRPAELSDAAPATLVIDMGVAKKGGRRAAYHRHPPRLGHPVYPPPIAEPPAVSHYRFIVAPPKVRYSNCGTTIRKQLPSLPNAVSSGAGRASISPYRPV